MRENPRCPYCNAEMYPNETLGGQRFFNCRICGACSPRKRNLKDAREAAFKILGGPYWEKVKKEETK